MHLADAWNIENLNVAHVGFAAAERAGDLDAFAARCEFGDKLLGNLAGDGSGEALFIVRVYLMSHDFRPFARSRSAICSACTAQSSYWRSGSPPASIERAMTVAVAVQFFARHCAW